jgi:hypothetical protein
MKHRTEKIEEKDWATEISGFCVPHHRRLQLDVCGGIGETAIRTKGVGEVQKRVVDSSGESFDRATTGQNHRRV